VRSSILASAARPADFASEAERDRPAAELVDEADGFGLLAGPDPALGDLLDLL
jgi:hypothetical protein